MRVVKGFSIGFVLIALFSLAACSNIGSWVKTMFSQASEPKSALKADAGPDQTVLMGDEVTLDGSSGTGEQVFWSFKTRPKGSEARLDIAERLATFQADRAGAYVVQLVSAEGERLSEVGQVTVHALALPAADRY